MHPRLVLLLALLPLTTNADDPCCPKTIVAAERFPTLVNPNCSHCVDEAKRRGSELVPTDNVLCWTRGYSDGGAIPFRFFLNAYPVISDSYGSFVSDPYAGFARAYGPWYHYRFHGWHGGVMLIKDTKDGTIYSALSGRAVDGPKKGTRLTPIPNLVSQWGDWLGQYPQAVAFHLFPKYQPMDALPIDEAQAKASRGKCDDRLPEDTRVLGVTVGEHTKAYLESDISSKQLLTDSIAGTSVIILWQPSTKTASAYQPYALPPRKFKAPKPNADGISPPQPSEEGLLFDRPVSLSYAPSEQFPAAPYVDAETKSRWDVTGRAVQGELKGWTLQWIDSVQVKWFAWSMEYPTTKIHGKTTPPAKAPAAQLNEKVKAIAGTAEFLRSVPKKLARFQSYDPVKREVRLMILRTDTPTLSQPSPTLQAGFSQLQPPTLSKPTAPPQEVFLNGQLSWKLTNDAEVKRHGWWGRPEQFRSDEIVWVWFATNRAGQPIAVSMLMDEMTMQDMHGDGIPVVSNTSDKLVLQYAKGSTMTVEHRPSLMRGLHTTPLSSLMKDERVYLQSQSNSSMPCMLYDQEAFTGLRRTQQQWLRSQWSSEGLPGTLTFTHVFNGELDIVLDHETMRWARSLQPGTAVQMMPPAASKQLPINGIVKFVQAQREHTLARLVVNGKDQAELAIGDRVRMKMPTPPASVDESPYPSDIDKAPLNRDERIEWFLASIYCTCGVDKDTCTGHVYTLSCCNPNGCGMPNDMRKQLGVMIDQGLDNRAIFDALKQKHGPLLTKPHLKP
jgi:hypothetical protein